MPAAAVAGGGTGEIPTGGILDPATLRWRRLPPLPAREPGEPFTGKDSRLRLRAAGASHVAEWGWVYDVRRRTWTELPAIPRQRDGLASHVEVWAGDRLFVFATEVYDYPDPGSVAPIERVPVRLGFSWRPH
jgi:hypothetical protein